MTVRNADALPAPSSLHGKVLSIVDPFPICWQALPGDRLWISARGHTLTIANDSRMLEILERLNAREKIRVEHDAPPSLLMLLAFLHGHDAVCEVSNDRVLSNEVGVPEMNAADDIRSRIEREP